MIQVELTRLIIDDTKKEQIIILKESDGKRLVPIVIGLTEAVAIKMKLSEFVPPRPLIHDLFCSTMEALGASIEKIIIDRLLDTTFHAKLYLRDRDNKEIVLDARPSDGVAIAVRLKAPIFVGFQVFKKLAVK